MMFKQCIKFDLGKNNIVADIIVKKGKDSKLQSLTNI